MVEQALESVLSIIHAIYHHWTSPEFRPVLWAGLAYIIGSAQGYTACLDGQEAAREDRDRDRERLTAMVDKEEYNG